MRAAPARKASVLGSRSVALVPVARRQQIGLIRRDRHRQVAQQAPRLPARWCARERKRYAHRRQSLWRARFAPGTARSSHAARMFMQRRQPAAARYPKNRTDRRLVAIALAHPPERVITSAIRPAGSRRFASAPVPAVRACRQSPRTISAAIPSRHLGQAARRSLRFGRQVPGPNTVIDNHLSRLMRMHHAPLAVGFQ